MKKTPTTEYVVADLDNLRVSQNFPETEKEAFAMAERLSSLLNEEFTVLKVVQRFLEGKPKTDTKG